MNNKKNFYLPGLDGLRAVAILVVFAYHLHAPWAQGGFIGVDIFFILSGYLITSAILREWQQTQSFDFKKFLYRRFKRLIPAVYFLIIVVVVYVLLFKPVILHTLRGDALASLFYSSNWWFIFHDVSYFDSFGAGSPLKNLWSLAIEEQFYFVWPIILLILLKYCQNKKQLLGVVVVMIILSISLMAWLFVPGSDPSRVYYGTDTRCFALLFGALLAIAIPTNRLLKPLPATAVKTLNYIGLGAFTLLLIGVLTLSELSSFLYYGGFVLVAFLAMIAVFVSAHPLTIWSKILATPPLHYFGTRSYSLYLWHYPVIILTTPITAAGVFSPTRSLLQFSITLVLAELSFRYVEAPIRQHGFKHVFRHFLPQQFKQTQPLLKSCFIALIVLFGIALGNVMTIFEEPTPKPITTVKITQKASKKTPPTQTNKRSYQQYLFIGDSLAIDISDKLSKTLTPITIDGAIGRQMVEATIIAQHYRSFDTSKTAIFLALGTNGTFSQSALDNVIKQFVNAHVYLVNTRVPRKWESAVNHLLAKTASKNKQVSLINWYDTAISHPEYFAPDGVHLEKSGIEAYVNLIEDSLSST